VCADLGVGYFIIVCNKLKKNANLNILFLSCADAGESLCMDLQWERTGIFPIEHHYSKQIIQPKQLKLKQYSKQWLWHRSGYPCNLYIDTFVIDY
jgi:hypothetical protein